MSYQEIVNDFKSNLSRLKDEFASQLLEVRAGRLSPALVENVKVECFGSVTNLRQLGVITTPSAREILIQLWDESYVDGTVKALREHDLGLGLKIDGKNIFLSQGVLTQEGKEKLKKLVAEKKEAVLQSARRMRDKAWRDIQSGFQEGEIREDDKYRGKDDLDKAIKDFRVDIEKMASQKEKEIES